MNYKRKCKKTMAWLLSAVLMLSTTQLPGLAAELTPEYSESAAKPHAFSALSTPANGELPDDETADGNDSHPEWGGDIELDNDLESDDSSHVSSATSSDAERVEKPLADEFEDVEIEINGLTYIFDLFPDTQSACLIGLVNPEKKCTAEIPATIVYPETEDGDTYTVTETRWSLFSSKCGNITELLLPDTLETLNGASFGRFPNLTQLTIPGSITNFDGTFQNMKKLEMIIFEEGIKEISSGNMVANCPALTVIQLPDTLELISGNAAFSSAEALTDITLPENVKFSPDILGLFSGCSSLTSMKLPASTSEIMPSMFKGCTSLTSVASDIPITSIGSNAFNGCTLLTDIPDLGQVTSIGSSAFNECRALPGPIDLSSVTDMGNSAFFNCRSLTSALDLSKLEKIPNRAFTYIAGISSIQFCDTLTSIGDWAFIWAGISELSLPDTLQSIGTYAFQAAKNLTGTITIPDSVTSIGTNAFAKTNVARFEIGSGISDLDAAVFADIAPLKEIIIHNSMDKVTISGTLPDQVTLTFTLLSVDDSVGDTISDIPGAPSLQDAVTAAAADGSDGTILIEKHVKLAKTVTIPAGKTVRISSNGDVQIAGTSTGSLKNLFQVEEGGSVVFGGSITLSGRYNSGSTILNYGSTELSENVVVTDSKITSDSANGLFPIGIGVIDSRGEQAEFLMTGGTVKKNAIQNQAAYCGIIRASDGAHVAIRGGEISQNTSSAAAALNSSSGLLLYGNASGEMTGGTISDNTGHRGSGVMLWGSEDSHRTRFEMTGGEIRRNTCTSSSVSASGAVHVENHASFHMTGGRIDGNKGGSGAGVCVVDGNLQQNKPAYNTGFVLDGGIISNNSGSIGGGIYSYSDGVELISGEITGNTASGSGGGIYSEGNLDYYSTLHMKNALVTANTARQGGGMWFCATGETTVYVSEGAAIFDNTARNTSSFAGAGDDFVFTALRGDDQHASTLANRMLGGGAAAWYPDGAVYLPAVGTDPIAIENSPRFGEEGADSDPVIVQESKVSRALKTIASDEAKALARQEARLLITGNTADRGGGIGANGGVIIGSEETTQISVIKQWAGDTSADRPNAVTVHLLNGNTIIDTAGLTEADGWHHTFSGLPVCGPDGTEYSYKIIEEAVSGYQAEITGSAADGFVITNTYVPDNQKPTPDHKTGNLTVSKTVSGNLGEIDRYFTFTVTLDDPSLNGPYGDMTFENGVAVFSLKHGESLTAADLPAGTAYAVAEHDNEGYTVTAARDTGLIEADQTTTAAFHNHRSGEDGGDGGGDGGSGGGGGNGNGGGSGDGSGGSGDGGDSGSDNGGSSGDRPAPPTPTLVPLMTPLSSADTTEPSTPIGQLPKTGDRTNLALWLALFGFSGMGLIAALTISVQSFKKKQK